MSYPKYDPRNRDPELQPTYEYETEEEFFHAFDYAWHNGTARPSMLDHPNADEMLRAGFQPSSGTWFLMVPGRGSQEIGLAHDVHGQEHTSHHMSWVHDIYGEGERLFRFYPRLIDALQAYQNHGPYKDYFRSPWGTGLPGDKPAYNFNDETLIQVEPPDDLS